MPQDNQAQKDSNKNGKQQPTEKKNFDRVPPKNEKDNVHKADKPDLSTSGSPTFSSDSSSRKSE